MLKKLYTTLLLLSCLAIVQIFADDTKETPVKVAVEKAKEVAKEATAAVSRGIEDIENSNIFSKIKYEFTNLFTNIKNWFSKKWSELFDHTISQTERNKLSSLPCPAPTPTEKKEAPSLKSASETTTEIEDEDEEDVK